MRVLVVGGVPGRLHEGPVDWEGHRFELTRERFDRFARFTSPDRKTIVVDEAALQAFVEVTLDYDVILCESPEAVFLSVEWRRRGDPPRGIVAIEVQRLLRVEATRSWYRGRGEADPWPRVCQLPSIVWQVVSPELRGPLLDAGVPDHRIQEFPTSTAFLPMMAPTMEAMLSGGPEIDGVAGDGLPSDVALVPGSGARDRTTMLRAMASLPDIPFVVVEEHAERRREELEAAGEGALENLTRLAPVPLERYVALVKRARVLVVPIEPGQSSGGQTTVTLGQRLGVPVVCSDHVDLRGYARDRENALLVPPGDEQALAAAIRELWESPTLRERLAEAGRRSELARADAGRDGMLRALRAAAGAAGGR